MTVAVIVVGCGEERVGDEFGFSFFSFFLFSLSFLLLFLTLLLWFLNELFLIYSKIESSNAQMCLCLCLCCISFVSDVIALFLEKYFVFVI